MATELLSDNSSNDAEENSSENQKKLIFPHLDGKYGNKVDRAEFG